MVYINDSSGTITLPKHISAVGDFTLILSSNMANDVTIVDGGKNISTNSLYYKFTLDNLNLLNVGEYTYVLRDESDNLIEEGLLMFGKLDREPIVNNTFKKTKIQYNGKQKPEKQ